MSESRESLPSGRGAITGDYYVNAVAASIIQQLKAGTAPWLKPWQPGARILPYNPMTAATYRGMNAVWLMSRAEAEGYRDVRWMTYRQARTAGAQVRKGAKGTVIQYWKWQGLEPVRGSDGAPLRNADGRLATEIVRYERPRVRSAIVFNAEQIEGIPPRPDPPQAAEWERHGRAEKILARIGVRFCYESGDCAFYRLADDTVTLPERRQFSSGDRFYATALHEVAHATGHPVRLNRTELQHPFGSEPYAREELRAEIASLMLGGQLGIGHDPGQHAAYVGSWIGVLENDPREIFRAASAAERITRYIVSFEYEPGQSGDPASGVEAAEPLDSGGPASTINPAQAAGLVEPARSREGDGGSAGLPSGETDDARLPDATRDGPAGAGYVDRRSLTATGPVRVTVQVDPQEAFARALRENGLRINGWPRMDGVLHRVPVEGDRRGKRSGAYVGHLDHRPAGYIQNFRTGLKTTWRASDPVTPFDASDRARWAAQVRRGQLERTVEREQLHERTAKEVYAIWRTAWPVDTHPYLVEKGVVSHGLRQDALGRLLVPVQDAGGKLWSVQRIGPDGFKRFYEGGRIEGGHFVIGDLAAPGPMLIAEGYATAASLYELTGISAIVAFNAGNLISVARTYREIYPDREIYIAGDNDHRHGSEGMPNVGREKAEEAAMAIRGATLLPVFAGDDHGSDWNDVVRVRGVEAARRQFTVAMAAAVQAIGATDSYWASV